MAQWESTELVFSRLIDALRNAESCAERLGFLHEDPRWIKVATLLGNSRDKCVDLATKRSVETAIRVG